MGLLPHLWLELLLCQAFASMFSQESTWILCNILITLILFSRKLNRIKIGENHNNHDGADVRIDKIADLHNAKAEKTIRMRDSRLF